MMSAVIAALFLAFVAGFIFRFVGFALCWAGGLALYATLLIPADLSIGQSIVSVAVVGVAAQIGLVFSVILQARMRQHRLLRCWSLISANCARPFR